MNADMPLPAREQLRYEIEVSDRAITVLESRPPWIRDAPRASGEEWIRVSVCRFRYTKSRCEWTLYWPDRHSEFHEFESADATPHIDQLIAIVVHDRTGIFWG